MPVLILTIPEDLYKLLQYRGSASVTPLCKLRRVVVMTVDFPFVFIVAVLRTENRRAHGTREMFNMIFSFQGRNVGSTKSAATVEA